MDLKKIKNSLISHREHAREQIDYIRAHPDLNAEELHSHIYDYVKERLLWTEIRSS